MHKQIVLIFFMREIYLLVTLHLKYFITFISP